MKDRWWFDATIPTPGGYFVGRNMASKAETETLELPDDDVVETDEIETNDEVE